MTRGVPQGFVLEPLQLFMIYLNVLDINVDQVEGARNA